MRVVIRKSNKKSLLIIRLILYSFFDSFIILVYHFIRIQILIKKEFYFINAFTQYLRTRFI